MSPEYIQMLGAKAISYAKAQLRDGNLGDWNAVLNLAEEFRVLAKEMKVRDVKAEARELEMRAKKLAAIGTVVEELSIALAILASTQDDS